MKLKLKYHGLKNLYILPNTLIFLILDNNKFLEEALKLNKNILLISNKRTLSNLSSYTNIIKIITANRNFAVLNFILEIITTAIFHGIIY